MPLRVLSATMFSPRGGSAQVARALADGLRARGHSVTLLAGSRGDFGHFGDARSFYGDVEPVDFGPSLRSADPMAYDGPRGTAPMHPSFEERAGAPDRVFVSLDDLEYELQVMSWARALRRAGAAQADVLHLHHLTPLNEAASRVAPHVPIVGQLHGTELLMLVEIEAGTHAGQRYAGRWAERLRLWANRCTALVVAEGSVARAQTLLGVPDDLLVPMPSGVDTEIFRPQTGATRAQVWHRALVDEPRGWRPGAEAGSIAYGALDVDRLLQGPILLSVGRFTAVKQIDRLLAAFAEAHRESATPAALVLVGGHPGEWEGEHPAQTVDRLALSDVYLAGWYEHGALPRLFSAADAVVMTSAREQFGLVLVEGMACERPAVATRSPGPSSIIDDGETGWLVDQDDPAALRAALRQVIEDPDERKRRGRAARSAVQERYSWEALVERFAGILEASAARALS